ncbi:MAG: hypothetical protein QG646_2184 [Euryarchaeota archaeon]|nr:hypothetical protein [Euryarchaeota archaeon]
MKQFSLFSLILTFVLVLMIPNLVAASLDSKTTEIPYQINNSDRIAIGTVSGINVYSDHTIYTITVKEWLYNPLPVDTIKVKTRIGTNLLVEDEAEFTKNESVLLMLKDADLNNQLFSVTFGFPGKRPVSDRDAVIKEIKAQGKWQEGNQTSNKTKEIKPASKEDEISNSTQKSKKTPFISPILVIAVIFVVFLYLKKIK